MGLKSTKLNFHFFKISGKKSWYFGKILKFWLNTLKRKGKIRWFLKVKWTLNGFWGYGGVFQLLWFGLKKKPSLVSLFFVLFLSALWHKTSNGYTRLSPISKLTKCFRLWWRRSVIAPQNALDGLCIFVCRVKQKMVSLSSAT